MPDCVDYMLRVGLSVGWPVSPNHTMLETADRLKRAELMLALIDHRRREKKESTVGSCVAWYIVDRELQELEREIRDNPGPLKAVLARRP